MIITKEWLQDLWTDTISDETENPEHIDYDEVMNMLTSLKKSINNTAIEDRDEEELEEEFDDSEDEVND